MTYRYPGGLVRRTAANTAITGASGVWDLGSQAQAVRNNTWPISGLANPVSGSLRFRASASAYLSRTPSATGSQTTWTWSGWVKQSLFGTSGKQWLLTSGDSGSISTNYTFLSFSAQGFAANGDQLQFFSALSNSTVFAFESTARFRDPAAWYHVVAAIDTTQATASNRIKLYINGVQITAFATATYPAQNTSIPFINSSSYETRIGSIVTYGSFDGYMAEVNFVNGQALTPASFGQTSAITGVWEPVKYTGTYGNNGYYLSLSDASSIGKDFSGRGNNWTPNNFSTANDSTFDLMRDVPTQWAPQGVTDVGGVVRGNYATLNPLWTRYDTNGTFSRGNLQYTGTGSAGDSTFTFVESTIAIPENSTGKWYWETQISATTGRAAPGIVGSNFPGGQYGSFSSTLTGNYAGAGAQNGVFYKDGSSVLSGQTGGGTANDYAMFAYDASSGKLWYGVNGTWWNSGAPASGTGQVTTLSTSLSWFPSAWVQSSSDSIIFNFGQRPFAYTPPSGFVSLCTTNLPTPTIGATTATAANKYFDATLITGTAATQVITNAGGFQPDFVWLKSRTNANNPTIYDAIRGVNTILYPALTNAEQVGTAQLTAFNSNGFTLGASENANDSNGEASVGWQWNAGGSTVTNTTGTISSQVRANPTAGFSIVTYTGNATSSQTVGHGLGVTPTFFILKSRGIQVWNVYSLAGGIIGNTILQLNTTDAAVTGGNISLTASPTTIGFGSASQVNGSGVNFVAYCFAPIAGYSAFGSYTGNGSADGPFVYTGFRPKFIIYKNATSATVGDWRIHDTSRSTFNAAQLEIYAQSADAEPASSNAQTDILSNGFKLRGVSGNTNWNQSGVTYIYAAFAETPFKNALAR